MFTTRSLKVQFGNFEEYNEVEWRGNTLRDIGLTLRS